MQQKQITSVRRTAVRFDIPYRLAQALAVFITIGVMFVVATACNAIASM
ncbi:hypothetical protein Cagg_3724 [Chloroflexus aggregans DSM 9485]|uniref:Uncharacterized protein n=1 Tax=Chloroflexus aggregans (strain MD-66 / DSM 9485) TaxID=326427 RepID=B8GAI5_CHLAD|nr:hypothetical protein Cagg_3724 [Chloroflexus aggregans DSM 9485]